MNSQIEIKLQYIYKNMYFLHLFSKEPINDFPKRILLRRFFILIDDYIKFSRRYNNKLNNNNYNQKNKIKNLINNLVKDWDDSTTEVDNRYDKIRDKISAKFKDLELIERIFWWNEIDLTTINIFFEQIKLISDELGLQTNTNTIYNNVFKQSDFKNYDTISISLSALSLGLKDRVGQIPNNKCQEKVSHIIALKDFFDANFKFTVLTNNPNDYYKHCIFENAWLLLISDLISLINHLYEDKHGDSLVTIWKSYDIEGYKYLEDKQKNRKLDFENKVLYIRNKLAAHVDQNEDLNIIFQNYLTNDNGFNFFTQVQSYILEHGNYFFDACTKDIRTKEYSIAKKDIDLKEYGVIKLASENLYKPFDTK